MEEIKDKIIELFFKERRRIESLRDNQDALKEWSKQIDDFVQLTDSASSDIKQIIQLYTEIGDSMNKKQRSLMDIFIYFLIAEGFICNLINFISYLLVLNEHDLFSITKRKYIKKDIKEITKVETSTKIQFLNHHGFQELTKKYDTRLRNKIAHHDYYIDKEGHLWIQGKKINLKPKLKKLLEIITFATTVFNELGAKI